MKIDRLEYFWGLFADPAEASATGAKQHLCLTDEEVSEEIQASFIAEGINELCGDYGVGGAGKPEEVSHVDITAGGKRWQVRVLNHGVSIIIANSPELVRLLRFFVILRGEADRRNPKSV